MAKFKFRLQSVLDLRKHREDEQKDVLAVENAKLNSLYDQKKALEIEYASWSEQYMKLADVGMTPPEAGQILGYLGELSSDGMRLDYEIASQKAAVEKERSELVLRMQERKSLEELCAKKLARFQYEQDRKYELQVEELMASRIKFSNI